VDPLRIDRRDTDDIDPFGRQALGMFDLIGDTRLDGFRIMSRIPGERKRVET